MADPCGRLIREIREEHAHPEPDIKLEVAHDSLLDWKAEIIGPEDTPYAGGRFKLKIKCPQTYPMHPPKFTLETPVFHPNVHWTTGEICMDILKNNWTPAWTLHNVCRALITLLSDPNGDSPLNCDAGNLVRWNDMRGFRSLAKMYTQDYALDRPSEPVVSSPQPVVSSTDPVVSSTEPVVSSTFTSS